MTTASQALKGFGVAVLRGIRTISLIVFGAGVAVGVVAGIGWLLPARWVAWVPAPEPSAPVIIQFVGYGLGWLVYAVVAVIILFALAKIGGFEPNGLASRAPTEKR